MSEGAGRCLNGGCGRPAIGLYTWGLYPHGEHNCAVPLCGACAGVLWGEVGRLVAYGACHFSVAPEAGESDE